MRIFWGQSTDSYDTAIKTAVAAAHAEMPSAILEWFEVIEFRGGIDNNVAQFQTAVRIGYIEG